MNSVELFLKALNAYKIWIDCGKDAVNHWDKFEAWDEAILVYADAMNISRNHAACEVYAVLDVRA